MQISIEANSRKLDHHRARRTRPKLLRYRHLCGGECQDAEVRITDLVPSRFLGAESDATEEDSATHEDASV